MEQTLRAKVKIFLKRENLKKMLLTKKDGHKGFIQGGAYVFGRFLKVGVAYK